MKVGKETMDRGWSEKRASDMNSATPGGTGGIAPHTGQPGKRWDAFCQRTSLYAALLAGALMVGSAVDAQWPAFRPIQPPFPPDVYIPPPPLYGGVVQPLPPAANNAAPGSRLYSDEDIRRNIQKVMAGDSFLHYFGIHVSVGNGVATLTGTADTWQDRARAEIDAYAGGAAAVDNRLQVRSP